MVGYLVRRLPAFLLCCHGVLAPAIGADLPSFDEFFQGVSECRLDMARYRELLEQNREGVLISLPTSGAVRGFLVESFYLAPGEAGTPDQYGLLFNGPLDAVRKAFPEFAGRHTVNGHLRKLSSLAEATGDRRAGRKTLLICVAGTPT